MSQERGGDVVQEALRLGASGYVVKVDAQNELLTAVNAVLRGETFLSRSLARLDLPTVSNSAREDGIRSNEATEAQRKKTARSHQVGFYSEDRSLLDDLTQFIGAALKAGGSAIVIATEAHRDNLLPRLQAYGVDVRAAIEQDRYFPLDATQTLSAFIFNGMPDSVLFMQLFDDLMRVVAAATKEKSRRVAIFGECVHLLWAQGNIEAAIQIEKLANRLAQTYELDILCGYSVRGLLGGMDSQTYHRICTEHSSVRCR
jgi:hypothetical protein